LHHGHKVFGSGMIAGATAGASCITYGDEWSGKHGQNCCVDGSDAGNHMRPSDRVCTECGYASNSDAGTLQARAGSAQARYFGRGHCDAGRLLFVVDLDIFQRRNREPSLCLLIFVVLQPSRFGDWVLAFLIAKRRYATPN